MKRALLFSGLLLCSQFALAEILDTPSFSVEIKVNCEEGNVTCNNVTYIGTSKKNGKGITLKGKTMHTKGPGGTPGRFLGYEFKNGDVHYFVSEEGSLVVSKNKEVLVNEKGTWR